LSIKVFYSICGIHQLSYFWWVLEEGGDIELLKIIDRLAGNEEISKANKEAVDRMINSHPILVDIDQAINVIPGMKENMILHSGPPIQEGP
jgi:hypothetical protein